MRFHRTRLEDHFRLDGRKTWFATVEEMQAVHDEYLIGYNKRRRHQGGGIKGRTPAQAFFERRPDTAPPASIAEAPAHVPKPKYREKSKP